jgi:hypothetical protein
MGKTAYVDFLKFRREKLKSVGMTTIYLRTNLEFYEGDHFFLSPWQP